MNPKIHKDELPREKLIKHGPEYLADYELLAILLNTGTKKENVLELAKRITKENSLQKITQKSVTELTKELGIGNAKACKVLATAELARRIEAPEKENIIIHEASDIVKLIRPKIAHKTVEHLVAIYLNTRRKVLTIKTLFTGSLSESLINPREIFKIALEENAAAVILAHNHPSNNPDPSTADIQATKTIAKAGNIMGIELLDHIIITQHAYTSLREQGFLES